MLIGAAIGLEIRPLKAEVSRPKVARLKNSKGAW
jgi:hypothetical protein